MSEREKLGPGDLSDIRAIRLIFTYEAAFFSYLFLSHGPRSMVKLVEGVAESGDIDWKRVMAISLGAGLTARSWVIVKERVDDINSINRQESDRIAQEAEFINSLFKPNSRTSS